VYTDTDINKLTIGSKVKFLENSSEEYILTDIINKGNITRMVFKNLSSGNIRYITSENTNKYSYVYNGNDVKIEKL